MRFHVTVMMAVPSMFELLTGNEHFAEYDTSSLRVAQTSGASVEQKSFLAAVKKLKIKHLIMGYGQTECAPLITATLYEDDLNKAVKTAGLPLPSVEVRIWNLEKDQSAASGEKGEIQVRGPITMDPFKIKFRRKLVSAVRRADCNGERIHTGFFHEVQCFFSIRVETGRVCKIHSVFI